MQRAYFLFTNAFIPVILFRKMSSRIMYAGYLPILAFLCLILINAPVKAGFEWTPPEQKADEVYKSNSGDKKNTGKLEKQSGGTHEQIKEPQAAPEQIKTQSSDPMNLVPDSVEKQEIGQKPNEAIQRSHTTQKKTAQKRSALSKTDADSRKESMTQSAKQNWLDKSAIDFETVQGFGENIPLALSLRQVVPNSFAFAFEDVSPGIKTSWSGGRSWDKILADIMRDINARAIIDENRIIISRTRDVSINEDYVLVKSKPKQPSERPLTLAGIDNKPGRSSGRRALDSQSQISAADDDQSAPTSLLGDNKTSVWTAAPGERLSDVLKDWTTRAGVNLFWNVESDYMLEKALQVNGDIEKAAQSLINKTAPDQLDMKIYPNLPNGPAVMLVRTAG